MGYELELSQTRVCGLAIVLHQFSSYLHFLNTFFTLSRKSGDDVQENLDLDESSYVPRDSLEYPRSTDQTTRKSQSHISLMQSALPV